MHLHQPKRLFPEFWNFHDPSDSEHLDPALALGHNTVSAQQFFYYFQTAQLIHMDLLHTWRSQKSIKISSLQLSRYHHLRYIAPTPDKEMRWLSTISRTILHSTSTFQFQNSITCDSIAIWELLFVSWSRHTQALSSYLMSNTNLSLCFSNAHAKFSFDIKHTLQK